MPYPVSVTIAPQVADRNRMTTFFRLILAIPHLILVGGIGLELAYRQDNTSTLGGGLLGGDLRCIGRQHGAHQEPVRGGRAAVHEDHHPRLRRFRREAGPRLP